MVTFYLKYLKNKDFFIHELFKIRIYDFDKVINNRLQVIRLKIRLRIPLERIIEENRNYVRYYGKITNFKN